MEDALAIARALEARDRELAVSIAELRNLEREVESLRGQAQEIQAALASYPAERVALEERRGRAWEELARRRALKEEAEQALQEAQARDSHTTRAEAEREVARARQAVANAEGVLARIDRSLHALEQRRQGAERAWPVLAGAALRVQAQLQARARVDTPECVPSGPDDLVLWASRARAALFLARSGLERERDGVVREANEMGASLLQDPLFAGGAAGLRHRLESR
ncbi:MAG: hypothetical protein C4306_10985 [Thermoleophilia bacterium]